MERNYAGLPPDAFEKVDPANDDLFYAEPRLVRHIDDAAVAALTRLYAAMLPERGVILDVMSACVSHLPPDFTGRVVGHGMNADELAANPQLDDFFVQNLNREPALPLDNATFDAALCCVGVQYLTQPDRVFDELARVLRPGAPMIVSFSNRCFPTKAVTVWRALDARGHTELVAYYLHGAGFRQITPHVLRDGLDSDPLIAVTGYR
ncbi:MAG: methyltransferase domain-containing protein [Hyphomicrobium aestuarii]|nr:methyltransferase domain-containing protein [Hyphomicrobium aestuarii]